MKKIYLLATLFISSLVLLTACDDDRDSNPTIQEPTTFELNTPPYASTHVLLDEVKSLDFTYSQPDYGYTAAVQYKMEVSLTNSFTLSVDEANAAIGAGESEENAIPDYIVLDNTFTTCSIAIEAATFAKSIMQLAKWESEDVPATQDVYVRMVASVDKYAITSNVLEIKVVPYYIVLKDADPELWYLIGSCIADGKWSNSATAIGSSMIPMSLVKDFAYDKATGQGELTYTGWLTPDGFKLVKTPGDWNDQWGSTDGGTDPVKNDGGSSNICVPVAGYYTVTLNTKDDELTVEAADITPASFGSMGLIGLGGDWDNDIVMTPSNAENNHVWYTNIEVAADTEGKFRADKAWSNDWGGVEFPYGFA